MEKQDMTPVDLRNERNEIFSKTHTGKHFREDIKCSDLGSGQDRKERDYWKKVRESSRQAERHLTSEDVEAMALKRLWYFTRGADLSDFFRRKVHVLAQYFSGNPAGPLPLDKGIMLRGGVGTGKTTLFKAFDLTHSYFTGGRILSDRNVLPYRMVSCNAIARGYADKEYGGVGRLNPYFSGNWVFDDLGTEDTARYYGQKMDVMGEILQERYRSFPHIRTFITTNLTFNDIEGQYGQRVSSRLVEMCSWLDMGDSEDFRRRQMSYIQV